MNQPIRWLLQGIDQQTKEEKALLKKYPLEIPTNDEQFREAIGILRRYMEPDPTPWVCRDSWPEKKS